MKRFLLTLVIALTAFTANAQETNHAIGLHFGGSTADLEYQYHFGEKTFLDATVGVFDFNANFFVSAVHNWNIKQWSEWTPNFATWKLWGGVGAGVGYYGAAGWSNFMLGPVGTLGFGFTAKKLPFTVGIDYRPMVALVLGDNGGIAAPGFYNGGLTVTYRF